MKNITLVALALGIVACNSPRPVVVDSGITLGDTGTAHPDTGMMAHPDTGMMMTGSCGTLSTTGGVWPALPATCLPRCRTATGQQYNTCAMMTDMMAAQNCIDAALAADTTPTVMVSDGTNNVSISCGGNSTDTYGCLDWQLNAAIDISCDAEFSAYLMCAAALPAGTSGMTGCPTEYMAIDNCITANMTAVQSDYTNLAGMCFGG